MSSATPTEAILRPAEPEDIADIVRTYVETRAAAAMPAPIYPEKDIREWLAVKVLAPQAGSEMWVAEVDGTVSAFAAFTQTWLDDLFVHPRAQGTGIGTMLLDLVKSLAPDGFGLWVFEMNTPARAFYARHGLREVERTDGSDNQEKAPDVRMSWP
ncbi:L-amino acid N-acyltransferase YncA [Nocardioides albertanoniae]|uniref:L-amino acid N-acyltransferase YncA n=1 Tax=Nocardioides albertanoniae TaxID=1175486 RepID=A0A543A9G5_9ACTN|nr:GNAT family N-acetyltransferase [Nocardioides albertanoniae]TQL69211.1 L-amino acid N-acyltransferase YncA [Nocardioides albertanoniae]